MRVVVTVGTHGQPFDRLIVAAEDLAAAGHEVWVQRGVSRVWPAGCRVADLVAPSTLEAAFARADAVVCHAGPATVLRACDHGHVPVVVPRDPAHGEHVDDHQLRFVEVLGDEVRVLLDPAGLPAVLASLPPRGRPDEVPRPGARAAFTEAFAGLVASVVRRHRG